MCQQQQTRDTRHHIDQKHIEKVVLFGFIDSQNIKLYPYLKYRVLSKTNTFPIHFVCEKVNLKWKLVLNVICIRYFIVDCCKVFQSLSRIAQAPPP